jgi:hypothetical protein
MYEDASVSLDSRLSTLITNALAGALAEGTLSVEELAAYTYLPSDASDDLAERILTRSYGVWRAGGNPETAAAVVESLGYLGQAFLAGADAPSWTTEVAYRSGLTLPYVFALNRAVEQERAQGLPEASILAWFDFLARVVRRLPQHFVQDTFDASARESGLRFAEIWGPTPASDTSWEAFRSSMHRFMRGEPISAVASDALEISGDVDAGRTSGTKPLPKTIVFLQGMSYRLSLYGRRAGRPVVGRQGTRAWRALGARSRQASHA